MQLATETAPRHDAATRMDDDALLTAKQMRALVGGVTPMCIWRWQRDPRVNFPAAIKVNRMNFWRRGDLRDWISSRITRAA